MSVLCKYDVFISYSRKDYIDEHKNIIPNNEISKIIKALDANGITYWIDEEGIFSGQNFTEVIVENIELSRIFIFLSTENSNASKWTSKEIATADEFGKHIIPVRIDKTPYNKSVMFRIADLDFIEYYNNGSDAGINKLISSVNKVLDEIRRQEEIEKEKKREAEIEEKREEIKAEIKLLEEDLYNQLQQEELILAQIAERKEFIKENHITCPICNTRTEFGKRFCHTCGWTFNSVEKLLSGVDKNEERKRINTAKTQWACKEKLLREQREVDSHIDRINELEQLCNSIKEENNRLKRDLIETVSEKNRIENRFNEYIHKLQAESQKSESLTKRIQQLEKNIFNVTQELSREKTKKAEIEKKQRALTENIKNLSKAYGKAQTELYSITSLKNQIKQLEEDIKKKNLQIKQYEQMAVSHDVILRNYGSNKILIIKRLKDFFALGLKEAKDIVDSAPCKIAKNIDIKKANDIKLFLEREGATVEIV